MKKLILLALIVFGVVALAPGAAELNAVGVDVALADEVCGVGGDTVVPLVGIENAAACGGGGAYIVGMWCHHIYAPWYPYDFWGAHMDAMYSDGRIEHFEWMTCW